MSKQIISLKKNNYKKLYTTLAKHSFKIQLALITYNIRCFIKLFVE